MYTKYIILETPSSDTLLPITEETEANKSKH